LNDNDDTCDCDKYNDRNKYHDHDKNHDLVRCQPQEPKEDIETTIEDRLARLEQSSANLEQSSANLEENFAKHQVAMNEKWGELGSSVEGSLNRLESKVDNRFGRVEKVLESLLRKVGEEADGTRA
jgi:phage shock protein A